MKQCDHCGQLLSEKITTCPTCGSEVAKGIQSIDHYRIVSVLHEGYSSVVCHAINEETQQDVAIRIFTPQSGVDDKIAARLTRELEILKELPSDYFVRHLEIRQSNTGLWYRVSEWIDTKNWSRLFTSDHFNDYRNVFNLFRRMASILDGLHQIGHFIPHLILNDVIVFEKDNEHLDIKIDYKVSRFLDPNLDRPGAMLKNLLKTHPDTIHHRPLNRRSDIWSLGKIFVEILSGDVSGDIDYVKTIDQLAIPAKAKMLFKTMLSDDRDLRPVDMTQVVQSLSQISDKKIARAQKKEAAGDVVGLKRWLRLTVTLLVLLGLLGGFAWTYFTYIKKDDPTLSEYANRYAGSVAFVMVDYQLMVDEQPAYHNRTEGTAFLVSPEGHLITNRHVACPWLEDKTMFQVIARIKQAGHSPRLVYSAYLWFEGQRAFKRLPAQARGVELEDRYHIESAYRINGSKKLQIVGVARPPVNTWQVVQSPLKDDFAVLKIEPVPENLIPLPLDDQMAAIKIPKLTPVMTLGFPLGSRTQTDTINVSVSTGHVRRTFKTMFQVDTSIYQGNSGGPVIDPRGRVVGIASSVYVNMAKAPVPVMTMLSDIGLVLPINKAAAFLTEIQSGQSKWTGYLDLAIDEKLEKIHAAANQGEWEKAQQLADKAFAESADLSLAMAAGLMHYCRNDFDQAKSLFTRALSMHKGNDQARMMLYLIDFITEKMENSSYQQALMALDWRSPAEIFGYLTKILAGQIDVNPAATKGDTDQETSLLHYIAGLIEIRQDRTVEAEKQFQQAVSTATGADHWPYFMATSKLESMTQKHVETIVDSTEKTAYLEKVAAFIQSARQKRAAKVTAFDQQVPLQVKLIQDSVSLSEKQAILDEFLAADNTNVNWLIQSAFYHAMDEKWKQALVQTRQLLKIPGRESAVRLAAGLLEPLLLNRLGRSDEAKTSLEAFQNRTEDPWYREISACLLDLSKETSLAEKAGQQPAYLVTGYVALGLWAEGNDETKQALRHYKEALGSYRDDRIEYQFAGERIKNLQEANAN